jgi:hypothetical protein
MFYGSAIPKYEMLIQKSLCPDTTNKEYFLGVKVTGV